MLETLGGQRHHMARARHSRLGYFDDPLVTAELEGMVDEMELLGYDFDNPEFMGNVFKDLGNKIKSAFNKKKGGSLTIGPQGVQYLNPVAPTVPAPAPAENKVQTMLKNPLVLGGAAVAVIGLVVIMKKKKRGSK
jgi:hypothetical protein